MPIITTPPDRRMNNLISASLTKMASATIDPSSPPVPPSPAPDLAHAPPPGDADAGGADPAAQAFSVPILRRTPEDAVDYVTVSDPVIHADGMNKYTSYRVDCRPPLAHEVPPPSGNGSGGGDADAAADAFLQNNRGNYSSVLRRYSDFLWLYERLHRERTGSVVPPLPEKQAVARFSPEFVEDRRRALERFLRRVVLHPELWDSECLATFLRADDVAFQHAKKTSGAEDGVLGMSQHGGDASATLGGAGAFNLKPKNAAGIKKWFSEAKTTFSGDLVASPDDDLFDEIERYVEALHVQMKRVSNQASGLVRKSREIANGMFEFGLAFHQLGQSEGEELGSKLQLMGGTADALSAVSARHAEAEARRLEEPFRDYLKTVQAVKQALGRRHDKRVSYTALLHEIQTREGNLHRLRMTPGSESKAYSAEMSLGRYRAAADVAAEEYAECSQRVLREVDRFKREKAEEMKAVVLEFILLEIEANRTMERMWAELAPKLEEGGSGGAEVSSGSGGGSQPRPQPTMVSMPPSQPPPPAPAAAPMPSAAQPTYSNVPAPMGGHGLMGGTANLMGGSADPMSESSIQYRNNDLPGMGL
ncbi:hypothetical protein ACHAWF_015971 [Thalassiosira exigua]